MDDLIAFLRDRLREAERVARALPSGPWVWSRHLGTEGGYHTLENRAGLPVLRSQAKMRGQSDPGLDGASWIELHPAFDAFLPDPARVLREVEARRRIVERYAWLREHGDTGDAAWVLPLLALPYADHPGYKEKWRP
jgi:hypothetical protein